MPNRKTAQQLHAAFALQSKALACYRQTIDEKLSFYPDNVSKDLTLCVQ